MIDRKIDQKELKRLLKIYIWLKHYSNDHKDYIVPEYYNKLLKEYSFFGKSDLDYLADFLKGIQKPNPSILELGCGSGRCTELTLKKIKNFASFTVTDLSKDMLDFVKHKYETTKIKYVQQDHLKFLLNCKKRYDIIYCLWSFSHSVHQHIEASGRNFTKNEVHTAIRNLVVNMLKDKGKLFMIHFDTCSEEQAILVKQYGKNFKEFDLKGKQSYSKRFLDLAFTQLSNEYNLKLTISHIQGDPIFYKSLDEAMEIFFNFHMETEYNRSKNLPSILNEVKKDLLKYKKNKGLYIRPGCFIYEIEKL